MNTIEKALMHGLFVHLHHNIDKVIDFKSFQELNRQVSKIWPGALAIGPEANDDAAVFQVPGMNGYVVAKMESHCSPCVPAPEELCAMWLRWAHGRFSFWISSGPGLLTRK